MEHFGRPVLKLSSTEKLRKEEYPFHCVKRAFHIVIFRWNSLFKQIQWKQLGTPLMRFILHRSKVSAATTTLQANYRVPIRDWRPTQQVEWKVLKESRSCLIRANLSSIRVVSKTIPMNSRTWEGLRVLGYYCGEPQDKNFK